VRKFTFLSKNPYSNFSKTLSKFLFFNKNHKTLDCATDILTPAKARVIPKITSWIFLFHSNCHQTYAYPVLCSLHRLSPQALRRVWLKSMKKLPPPLLSKTERDNFSSFRSSVKRLLSSKSHYQHIVSLEHSSGLTCGFGLTLLQLDLLPRLLF
jgi:hypothetical protein